MIPKESLKEILLEQKKRIEEVREDFIMREKLTEIEKYIKIKHGIMITGIRRCGKSVFLSQIMKKFYDRNYYVNFEDERLADFNLADFSKLYEVFIELFGKTSVFFLDEIQNVAGWERWVRRMYEDGFKFFITGSNARLLSKELASLLTGRHLQIQLFPFSFMEYLDFHKFKFKNEDVYITERKVQIAKYLSDYLVTGGFPEYLRYRNIEILQGYFNDIVQRDIVERYKVKNIRQMKELARYLISNTAKLTSYNQLKKFLEMKSVNTVIKYIHYLENAYMLFSVPYFSYSLKQQSANPFKIFSFDMGLRNAIGFMHSQDMGRVYETAVAIDLKRRDKEIYYWKNLAQEEVDFVIRNGARIEQLVQVCYDINDPLVKKRETRSLVKAGKELKCRDLLIITGDYESEERLDNKTVKFIPLWKWLVQ